MKRTIINSLLAWSVKKNRKPLVLSGARQVGKTWILKEFGRVNYPKTAYFNFDASPELSSVFDGGFDITRLVIALGAFAGIDITPGDTLLIFDEIQLCPKALTALKYWCEDGADYHVAAAGSLIGLAMNEGTGYPVGKTESMTLYPMTFHEFLEAMGEGRLAEAVKSVDMLDILAPKLKEYLRYYFYVGGMPAAVASFADTRSFQEVREIQENILLDYRRDFSRHVPKSLHAKVVALWNALPVQLDRTDRRFVSSQVQEGGRSRDFRDAFEWLEDSGLAYRVWNVTKPAIPLSAYRNHLFKLFSVDIGLLAAQSGLSTRTVVDGNRLFTEYKGALCEQFVQQELRTVSRLIPYYWTTTNSQTEIDFVCELGEYVVPVEVKAEINLRAKSLKSYREQFCPELSIRTSMADYKENEGLADVPLFAIRAFVERRMAETRTNGGEACA